MKNGIAQDMKTKIRNYNSEGDGVKEKTKIKTERPIEPEMQLLWERIESVARTLDNLVITLVGEPRGFTLILHAKSKGNASLSVSNLASHEENYKVVAAWLAAAKEAA